MTPDPSEAVEACWTAVYADTERWWDLYELAEKLVDLDDALLTWRQKHVLTVERIIGPCWGITVRSRSVVGTTCAGCQTIFGGEITMFSQLASETRNEAMNRL